MKNNQGMSPITITSWVAILLLIVLQGCLNKDRELELAFTKTLIQHKTDNILSIDLRTVLGTQWEKVCLQGPYMLKENPKRLVLENLRGFEDISDDRFVFWVFYTNGQTARIEVETVKVMDYRGSGSFCTSFQYPYLYFNVIGGEKKYFFNDKGELK